METPVIIPSRDDRGAPGRTIAVLWNVLVELGREPVYFHSAGYGYAQTRTEALRACRETLEVDSARGFLIDDDILLLHPDELCKAIETADKYGWNIVAPYKMMNQKYCLLHSNLEFYTEDEVEKLSPYDPVAFAGLGFYYGNIPLDYKFHLGLPLGGEDLNFFMDNKIELRVAKIPLQHLKLVPL